MASDLVPTPTDCIECLRQRRELDAALARIAELKAQVRELLDRLGRNSSNSSTPPSADPLGTPRPAPRTPSGRKPGGQLGHKGHHRHRLPPQRVNRVGPYIPATCGRCQTTLPCEPSSTDPEPAWHQVAELPELAAEIIEHQAHTRTCPDCGHLNWGEIPPEVRAHVIGPRLAAVMSYFSGRLHVGRRLVEEVVETVFDVPTSLGSIITLEAQTSIALDHPHQEAARAVRQAAVKNTDETGWSEKGQKRWLWGAATATAAFFVIHLRRSFVGLQAWLGETPSGIVASDRWSAYSRLPLDQRQICWAHLKRDFQKLADRGGSATAIGQAGLEVVSCLFADWWEYRRGELSRPDLQARMGRTTCELPGILEGGCRCADGKTAAFCVNVLALYPALWLFTAVAGVEPTNNHAERVLRSGVLWRKNAFGCHRAEGCRFVERMLTVVQTLRLQNRPVLDYLYRAIVAHRSGLAAPQLLVPAGD